MSINLTFKDNKNMSKKLFPTTVVGSMTRPRFFRDLVDHYLVEGGTEERLDALLDRSIPYVIALQEAAGLDIVSDGEWRRKSYIGVVSDIVTGFDIKKLMLMNSMGPNGEAGYSFLLNDFKSMNLDMVMFELCYPDDADLNMLANLPESIDVGVGCVRAKQNGIDTPDQIVSRVKNVIGSVEPHRIFMHPDCGFSPGAYWDVPLEEAYEKLSNQVTAAEILRKEFS